MQSNAIQVSKLIERAQRELLDRGITYPIRYPGMPISEYYDAVQKYGELESSLIASYQKPIALVKTKNELPPKKLRQWARPYYDDED